MENGKYKLSIEKRMTTVEIGLQDISDDVKEIRDNHLKHLDAKVDRVQWLIVTTLITLVVGLIMKLL